MSAETFLLFISILIFGSFNVILNLKTADKGMKLISLISVFVSVFISFILLAVSFARWL